jgi:hypothetical protein
MSRLAYQITQRFRMGELVITPRGQGLVKFAFPAQKRRNRETTYAIQIPGIRLALVYTETELFNLNRTRQIPSIARRPSRAPKTPEPIHNC